MKFHQEYAEDDVWENYEYPKSCALNPIPTNILKEFLTGLLPYMVDICNASQRQGKLPMSHCRGIVMPHLKKPNADPQ